MLSVILGTNFYSKSFSISGFSLIPSKSIMSFEFTMLLLPKLVKLLPSEYSFPASLYSIVVAIFWKNVYPSREDIITAFWDLKF